MESNSSWFYFETEGLYKEQMYRRGTLMNTSSRGKQTENLSAAWKKTLFIPIYLHLFN